MSLSSALHVANSALMNSAAQADVISRNISNVDRANYARRSLMASSNSDGGLLAGSIVRATDRALSSAKLVASSDNGAARAVRDCLLQLSQLGGVGSSATIASMISSLGAALDSLSEAPGDTAMQNAVVDAARSVVQSLNEAAQATQKLRAQADADMANSVAEINDLLGQFKQTNDDITKGAAKGGDVSDAFDRRDDILLKLSAKIGIHTLARENGDMAIFTDTGVTLFDRTARVVSLASTPMFDAHVMGAPILVDGVPLGGASNPGAASSGELVGLMRVRDQIAPTYQAQLDETARALALAFSEHDPSGLNPDAMGLFTTAGETAVPEIGAAAGLASTLQLAASVDPAQGGDAALLRDGGIAGPAYKVNIFGHAGFSDRIMELSDALGAAQNFDPTAQAGGVGTIEGFSANSISWLEAGRKTAEDKATYQGAILTNITKSLSNATGVNLDDEMSKMIAIENSYNATTKLITTVDSMFQALLKAIG